MSRPKETLRTFGIADADMLELSKTKQGFMSEDKPKFAEFDNDKAKYDRYVLPAGAVVDEEDDEEPTTPQPPPNP
jgi:bifunctional DNA-binding transcriptional regulator/antitoxin component of YhaV-PrlF toxin-antitoxin module